MLQTAKLHKYLSSLPGVEVHVVTSNESSRVSALLAPRLRLEEGVTRFDLFSNRYVNHAVLRFLPALASRPDLKRAAVARSQEICAVLPWRPDIILSRSYPISSALLGQAIAEKLDVPWIMQLSDPWSLSPLHPRGYDLEWNRVREHEAIARADRVTFTSIRTLKNYASLYPTAVSRFRYFPNTYDPEHNTPNPWRRGDKFRLVYTGTLGGSRHPEIFFSAIDAFLERVPQARGSIVFTIAGHADREVRAYFAKCADYLDWKGPVDFDTAMGLIRSADVLSLIDNSMERAAGTAKSAEGYEFFPSKLLDYMLGQRPILGVSPTGSIAQELIESLELGLCFDHSDVAGLSKGIEQKWKEWQSGDPVHFERNADDDTYDARAAANRLYREMESILDDA